MTLSELLHHRRAVRYFDPDKPLDSEKSDTMLAVGNFGTKQF